MQNPELPTNLPSQLEDAHSGQIVISGQTEMDALFHTLTSVLFNKTNGEVLHGQPKEEYCAEVNALRDITRRLIACRGINPETYPSVSWLRMGLIEFVPGEKLQEFASVKNPDALDFERQQIAQYFLKKKQGK